MNSKIFPLFLPLDETNTLRISLDNAIIELSALSSTKKYNTFNTFSNNNTPRTLYHIYVYR